MKAYATLSRSANEWLLPYYDIHLRRVSCALAWPSMTTLITWWW